MVQCAWDGVVTDRTGTVCCVVRDAEVDSVCTGAAGGASEFCVFGG